jgi:hypothetical protein
MKRPTAPLFALLFASSVALAGGDAADRYGAPLPADAEPVPLATAIARAETEGRFEGTLEGRITQVCRRKGCFVVLADDAAHARVVFRDYAFFVPTDTPPGPAVAHGMLEAVALDHARADHYAADAGEDRSEEGPVREWRLVATGIELH